MITFIERYYNEISLYYSGTNGAVNKNFKVIINDDNSFGIEGLLDTDILRGQVKTFLSKEKLI